MHDEKSLLESMIIEALDSGQPLYSPEIVRQSQELDKHIVNVMRGGM